MRVVVERRCTARPSAISAAYARQALDRGPRERRDQPPTGPSRATAAQLVDRAAGDRHRRVESAVGREVLDLDVDEHLVAARVERVVERRDGRRSVTSTGGERVVPHEQLGPIGDAAGRRVRRRRLPARSASRNASSVFSGASTDAPRWAITSIGAVWQVRPPRRRSQNRPLSNGRTMRVILQGRARR